MRTDSRLSGVIHLLLHLAEHDGPASSAVLARAMRTHPVVVRRVLAGLRDAGYVRAERGAGGGWRLAVDLGTLTLADVHEALGAPRVVAMGHRSERPRCRVEQAVNEALERAFGDAEARFLESLAVVPLASLRDAFRARAQARGNDVGHELGRAHA